LTALSASPMVVFNTALMAPLGEVKVTLSSLPSLTLQFSSWEAPVK